MTELEKKIYNCAMEILPEATNEIKKIKPQARYISIPFFCDGCYDSLIYDTEIKKFTKIEYRIGIGSGISMEGMCKFSGFFDDIKICEIDISNLVDPI